MAKVVRIHSTGGPEVLTYEDVDVGAPGAGEIRVAHEACGLNFIDTYHRSGLYPLPLPSPIGLEAAGTVTEIGDGVTDLKVGDRIAYGTGPIGSYATERVMPAAKVVKIPEGIETNQAAGMMLKGMTVEYLIRRTFTVKPGDTVLFHAAAGGVGLIACQWLKQIGATIIGTTGSEEKAELAKAHGCDHVILYRDEDVVSKVKELTDGKGVPVVYDSVGKDTWEMSLDCLQPRGTMVTFGNASGPVDNVNIGILAAKGSLYVTRPTLMTYTASREDLVESATALFDAVSKGVKIEVNQSYALADVQKAHTDLEARKTTGSTILIP
ncbi:quinone oxidoreductase family protein [Hwanghaeella sp.]|uniref:quinone oxidoreductase family protein n=1 Tax=Hwanghaeella sp. TaxID=2605943 RepID=UPI003CCC16F4